jgi:hypothetical protein
MKHDRFVVSFSVPGKRVSVPIREVHRRWHEGKVTASQHENVTL